MAAKPLTLVEDSNQARSISLGEIAIAVRFVGAAGTDVTVRELTLRTPTLDDVFLDLTGTHIERANTEEDAA